MKYIVLVLALLSIAQGIFVSNDSVYESLPKNEGSYKSRICVFIETDTVRGDLGTMYLNLAEALQEAGHDVTILVEQPIEDNDKIFFTGFQVQVVPEIDVTHTFTPAQEWQPYRIYEHLKTQQFDVVHFPDWKGNAYYAVLAKHQGIAFEHTVFVIGAQQPFVWSKVNNFERVKDTKALEIDYMQRLTIEHADIVVSPSQFMLNYLTENGWTLPAQSYVEQNIVVNSRITAGETDVEVAAVDEIVFYGDLQPSEGLVLFCDALDKLSKSSLEFRVTFLGDVLDVQGIAADEYIQLRSRMWTFDYSIVSGKDRYESLRFLSVGSRMAVVAPERSNSPLRIEELLLAKIPFLASNVGGISELVDSDQVLFAPRHDKLALKMEDALKQGVELASFAHCPVMTKNAWVDFFGSIRATPFDVPLPQPLVTVVVVHHNRPALLRQALASVESQTYENIEVVLIDDASDQPEAIAQIAELKPVFEKRGWKLIQLTENSYLGKARNTAVQQASGEFVVFLDDDNVLKPNAVETFVRAALNSGADLLTSAQDFFHGSAAPVASMTIDQLRVPLGGDVATGFFWNCFGDANSFVKRSAFLALGGFTEDYQVGYEDYEFFAKAVLKGYSLEVVPESLYWYRRAFNTMSFSTPLYKNRMRYLRPYMENLSPSMSNLFLYVQSMHYGSEEPFMGSEHNTACNHTDCNACVKDLACGWCESSRKCVPGDMHGSTNCTVPNAFVYNGTCANCQDLDDKCDDCSKNAKCGFCKADKTCEFAGVKGSIVKSSPCHATTKDWITKDLGSCSKSSDKTKLIIIIVCSVGGGLLLFAAVALIAFFLYQRNSQPGYTPINQG